MVSVLMDEDYFKSLLKERAMFWKGNFNDEEFEVLCEFFEDLVDNGCFEGGEIDIKEFVDNALINDYKVFLKDDFEEKEFKKIQKAYDSGKELVFEEGSFGGVVFKSANGRAFVVRR